jgi:hypothetical protein
VDFCFHFGLGEWGERQGRKPISRFEQMCHPAAAYLRPQQSF